MSHARWDAVAADPPFPITKICSLRAYASCSPSTTRRTAGARIERVQLGCGDIGGQCFLLFPAAVQHLADDVQRGVRQQALARLVSEVAEPAQLLRPVGNVLPLLGEHARRRACRAGIE